MWLLLVLFLAQDGDFAAQGMKALEARQFAEAAELFSKAVAADPKDYGAHFQLALSYSLLGRDAEAIPEYQKVLELQPGLYEAEMNLGVSLLQTKDAAGALPHLQKAAEQKPMEFRPQFYLAEAQFAVGQFTQAEAAYRAALELNAQSAPAELGLGRSLAREGKRAEAEPHYRKATTLDPSYRETLLDLASLYEDAHQLPEAIAIYREFPNDPRAVARAGELLLETGQVAESIPALESAVAAAPTPGNRLALAQAYAKQKQPAKAEPLAAQAVADAPQDLPLRMFYGRLLRDQRKFPEAAAQFLTAAQMKPDSVETWNELSGVYMAAEQYPQALMALDRVRGLGAETTSHFYIRGVALDHLHQIKDALENYNKFLERSQGVRPDEEFLARQRARVLQRELGKR
jgi:tetratricopeptide (TPR) repeat protein